MASLKACTSGKLHAVWLQANLLQPLADPATLELRLDAVEELLGEVQLRADVQV